MIAFTKEDHKQLAQKGIAEKQVLAQIQTFSTGIPFVQLEKAAVIGDGIIECDDTKEQALLQLFEQEKRGHTIVKFVPASGAASRMFKALFNFLETYDPDKESLSAYIARTEDSAMQTFFEGLHHFAFYEEIHQKVAATTDKNTYAKQFVAQMLLENGKNYGFYPKGLLPFHKHKNQSVTPFEEHLREASLYAKTEETAKLHFTISEQHQELFNTIFKEVEAGISKDTATKFEVTYSFQHAATDTIAVTPENVPFRTATQKLLFRPGGHGALIQNLNEIEASVVFIKNIDNVVVAKHLNSVASHKKILGGLLLELQNKAFSYAQRLEEEEPDTATITIVKTFLETELNARFQETFNTYSLREQVAILKDKINRPIRVCGMVKNEGEPGGGPFWIKDQKGNVSLQIVESAQMNLNNPQQTEIVKNATHFNPVDIVCGIRNYSCLLYTSDAADE